jgi:ATP-dependent DNA ligase
MDSIGKVIASEIPISIITEDTMERIVMDFNFASGYSGRNDRIGIMQQLILSKEDRAFVLECLYGNLKLGISIQIPDPVFGEPIRPQLCGTGIEFNAKEYIIEEKFDGHRCVGINDDGKVKLYTRGGKPLIAEAITAELADAIPPGFVIDGELVAMSGEFQDLKRHEDEIEYHVFDIPFHMNNDITGIPLHARRIILEECLHETNRIQISPILHLANMQDIDQWIERNNAEGIVAKDPESPYLYGGRKDWIKVKPWLDVTCQVTGFTQGTGKRSGDNLLGAIEVIPVGSQVKTLVGTGFSDSDLVQMRQLLQENKNITVDIKYQNWTKDGCLRFPVFLRIREAI